jgi:hypothetical protein
MATSLLVLPLRSPRPVTALPLIGLGLATGWSLLGHGAGTPQERTFNRSLDCGNAGEGNGLNLLFDASSKGQEIRTQFG